MQSKATNSSRLSAYHFVLKTRMTNAHTFKYHISAAAIRPPASRAQGTSAGRPAAKTAVRAAPARQRAALVRQGRTTGSGKETGNGERNSGGDPQPDQTKAIGRTGWGLLNRRPTHPAFSSPVFIVVKPVTTGTPPQPACFAPSMQRPTISSGSSTVPH
jgi:hypothetical protein